MTSPEHARIEDLASYAAANGWTYQPAAEPPALSGDMWEYATAGNVQDRVAGPDWEVGRIVGGARKAENVRQNGIVTIRTSVSVNVPVNSINLGYLAIRLPRQLPHFLLDARSNNGILSSLQHQPQRKQRLSLEGDFDSHFHLFAPRGMSATLCTSSRPTSWVC
ncbi:hypothetical protein [Microbacterium testaceum]|uniref:hypothetical protein n=1 Tax=Microbacterium testaceum TaxID=2033 RepID=UPI0025B046F2|nr:hypothetical protein [Microbacterium testaceum]WJS89735.1 hypothetical protein NYQ11_10320 [Microbacterium testaceum]